jgi:hypothetical protein
VHPSGSYALCANFERLYFCRPGYRYLGVANENWNKPVPAGDGISRLCLETGQRELLIETEALCQLETPQARTSVDHWLEHIIWNPKGDRFAFLHRWNDGDGGHFTRLYTADADGGNTYRFPDMLFYSHMGWRNDREFTIWGRIPSLRGRAATSVAQSELLRKLVMVPYQRSRSLLRRHQSASDVLHNAYIHFQDQSSRFELVAPRVLRENGHNTWSNDGRWMLTDTYSDEFSQRHLLLYDHESYAVYHLGEFDSPYNDCGYRCDLHPRFDLSNRFVIIDSAHCQGTRQMTLLDVGPVTGGGEISRFDP